MRQMTFQQIREATPDIYPDIEGLDDAFKNAVNMWYDTREVSDNENFARFFQRILYRDFGQYKQLLRIEPGISQYDWLVQTYSERMETRDHSGDETETVSGTTEQTRTDRTTASTTTTDTRTVTTVVDEDTSGSSTRTDNLTTTDSGSHATAHGHAITSRGTAESEAGGSDTTEQTGTTKDLEKFAPQSISYSSGTDSHDSLDWQYPSGQRENGTESESTTRYGRTDETTTTDTTTHSGTDTTTTSGTTTHTGTQGTTASGERDSTTTQTHGGQMTAATTHGGTLTDEGSTESERARTTADSDITKARYSGRSLDIATLLGNATVFIVSSSAFEWMRKRLEPAFQGIY